MDAQGYKIDPSNIDERLMSSKTRQDWLDERLNLQRTILHNINIKARSIESVEMITNRIKSLQDRIDYIDEVLERWYSDMCIRCGKLTEVDTYCGQATNCKHCLSKWVNRAIATLSEDDLESIEKQLTDLQEGD